MSVLKTLAVSAALQALLGGEEKVYPGREGTTTSKLFEHGNNQSSAFNYGSVPKRSLERDKKVETNA